MPDIRGSVPTSVILTVVASTMSVLLNHFSLWMNGRRRMGALEARGESHPISEPPQSLDEHWKPMK